MRACTCIACRRATPGGGRQSSCPVERRTVWPVVRSRRRRSRRRRRATGGAGLVGFRMGGTRSQAEVSPVSGNRITDEQVRLYMKTRKSKTQELAAAKAGISERSARRIEQVAALPSQTPRRYWRARADPFAQVWDTEVLPLLCGAPKLMAVTLLRKLQDDHPERFPDGMLRTLQRHIRRWRALEGPPKEVFFPQDHAPGHRGLSDFTAMGELRITIADAPFAHLLYHFVLAFSRW